MRRRGLVVQAPAISHFVAVGLGYVLFFFFCFSSSSFSLSLSLLAFVSFFMGGWGLDFTWRICYEMNWPPKTCFVQHNYAEEVETDKYSEGLCFT